MAEIVTSLLGFVSDKLASRARSEFTLLTGLDKELKKLESTLSTIRDVLEDAEARQVKEKAISSWLRKLKDLAYDADDVLDEIAFQDEKSKKDGWKKVFKFFSLIIFRLKIAHRVKEINERLDQIAKNRSNFHLKEGVGQSSKRERSTIKEETGSYLRESEVYGRQGDKEKIVELLMNTSTEGDNIDVIGIVGLGGLGKTTLARLVYNEQRVDEHFEKKMWVCVSEEFEIRKLIIQMIESATGEKFSSPENMDALQTSLKNKIKEKRFLLVLDDVWNENYQKWDSLRTLLRVSARGSKVMVTTQIERVASMMGAISPHQLSRLSLDDCWLLFESIAFGRGVERNQILVEIGKEIVEKCRGLPLAAKALGSLLSSKKTASEWEAITDSDLWDKNDEVLPSLKLSYDHLSSDLKQCFTYCSIFPKDYVIDTDKLVKLWGAEGFLKPSESQRHMHWEDIGLGYVRDLLARSLLFQEEKIKGKNLVKMHDLVHDLARSVAGDEYSIFDTTTGRNFSQNSRYASFICNENPLSVALQSLLNAKKLRTFYLDTHTHVSEDTEQSFQKVLHVISCDINRLRALHLANYYPLKALPTSFKKLKHLRYLDLSWAPLEFFPPCISTLHNLQTLSFRHSEIKSIPDSIGNLHNLCTLDISFSFFSSVPSSISQLKCLRELDLSYNDQIESLPESICTLSNLHTLGLISCRGIHELPQNLSNMKSLVHLNIQECGNLNCMPGNLRKLNQLRTLPIFILGGKTKCSSLTELGSLKLEGELQLKNLENVRNVEEAKGAQLSDKHRIQSLILSWGRPYYETEHTDVKIQLAEDVLQSLQPTKSLRYLQIQYYLGRTFPPWMMELSLSNLVRLKLEHCNCEKIPALGQLPQLEVLELESLPLIKHLGSDFYGGANAFPSLRYLELDDMIGLEEWCDAGGEQLHPCLRTLTLYQCPKLKALPSNFSSSVQNLNMNVDHDKLLLSSLQNRGFPNVKQIIMWNFNNDIDPMLTERVDSLRTLAENLNFDVSSEEWCIRFYRA